MARIKIISNPYQKRTTFQSWDEATAQWWDIDEEHNANSGLLRGDLCTGFFPFKAKQIVDIIVAEYYAAPDKVELLFEGTADEYDELKAICAMDVYSDEIALGKSARYLENARDILPDIIDVYKELSPLVADSVSHMDQVRAELDKFTDASNDIVPICVIGNYSSGKSTFINALIGYELLPSSDEPTTAKIYKITQSMYPDRASVKFEYDDRTVRIRFTQDSASLRSGQDDTPLAREIVQLLGEIGAESIPRKLSRILEVINLRANTVPEETDRISDLIEIEAPFDDDGLWGRIRSRFVIFDTPGSNSASNRRHYDVLKKAMENMSNGIPVFVSEYDALDSTDNDKLYQDINGMEEMDNRFTMIIVNKADAASLKKAEFTDADRSRILSLSIPRNLYSGGIYFVSSIMGLGAKNDEDFIGEHTAEVFEDQRNKYVNPNSRFYKQLFRYDIMPEQIRIKYNHAAEQHHNLIYANSGLFSVEQAIETFAKIYSSYNKCQQSRLFLGKIIRITSDEIMRTQKEQEQTRGLIEKEMEEDKRELMERLQSESSARWTQGQAEYAQSMDEARKEAAVSWGIEEIRRQREQYRSEKAEEGGVEERKSEVAQAIHSFGKNFTENVTRVFKSRDLSDVQRIGADMTGGVSDILDNIGEWNETREGAEKAASDEMMSAVRERFTLHMEEGQETIRQASQAYWAQRAETLKEVLSGIVTDSTALSDAKKAELSGIILEYQELTFDVRAEKIFAKDDFLNIFVGKNRINVEKLASRYNLEMQKRLDVIYETFRQSHANSFSKWKDNLLDIIFENIVEYNPNLHQQAESIRALTARIEELILRKNQLDNYTVQINDMMHWKEA